MPHVITGWWKDTGRPEDMLEANRIILDTLEPRVEGNIGEGVRLEGKVVIQPGAQIRNSRIRGPAIIGSGILIEEATSDPSPRSTTIARSADRRSSIHRPGRERDR